MIRTEISDSRLQTSVSNLSSLCNIVETEETHATFKITEDFFFFFSGENSEKLNLLKSPFSLY